MKIWKIIGLIFLAILALAFWPFAIGGGIVWYLWKKRKIQNTKFRYSLITICIFLTLFIGSSWVAALNINSPSKADTVSKPTTISTITPTVDDSDSGDTILPPKFKAYTNTTVQNLQNQTDSIAPNINTYCLSNPLEHVYHPQRLQIINNCIQISGTIENVKAEPDGDYHINVKLDSQFTELINDKNTADEHGDLVVETVCEHTVTQTDAESTCSNYHSDVAVPTVGSHVFIVGSYVLDRDHGWMEIHPATYIGNATVNVYSPTSVPFVQPVTSNSSTTNSTTTSSTTQTNGATGKCNDGTETFATNHQGACSHHGGVAQWY